MVNILAHITSTVIGRAEGLRAFTAATSIRCNLNNIANWWLYDCYSSILNFPLWADNLYRQTNTLRPYVIKSQLRLSTAHDSPYSGFGHLARPKGLSQNLTIESLKMNFKIICSLVITVQKQSSVLDSPATQKRLPLQIVSFVDKKLVRKKSAVHCEA
jgi:hypothetical protein